MKKGVSEIISWVLLVGFAVSLAAVITVWTFRNTEQTTEGVIKMVTEDIKCSEVYINLGVDCTTKTLTIMNNGKFKIDKVLIRDGDSSSQIHVDLMPNNQQVLNSGFNSNNVEVVPLVKVGKELIGCSDKSKEVTC